MKLLPPVPREVLPGLGPFILSHPLQPRLVLPTPERVG